MQARVIKQVLSNGLTILIKPTHSIPKVSTQLWYNVGSKDEKVGEKGIAHFIEHMIFKGTKRLSECDINLITNKLSGYANAFTSYDYTGYLFDFPSQNWLEALPIMADCMHNATFKEEHLHSELKAVIQELKMYKDDYTSSLVEALLAVMFTDHPYHYPIIGYKTDLWHLKRDILVRFYQHHYITNNATLVIVGEVDPDEAIKRAEKEFGQLKPHLDYKKEQFYHAADLKSQTVTLYRDVQIPTMILAWVVPGTVTANDYMIDIVTWVLASGKGSRLYKKIVDELQLATDLDAFSYDLFDYAVIFVYIQPKDQASIEKIARIVEEEIHALAEKEITEKERLRAIKQVEVEWLSLQENNQKQAYAIGKFYLATKDENYLCTFTEHPKENLGQQVREFIAHYLRPSLMTTGLVLPLTKEEKSYWVKLQELSDLEDQRILGQRVREAPVEEGQCVVTIEANPPKPFTFSRAQTAHLNNGLKILYCDRPQLPKIDLIVDFTAKYTYDPEGKEGLSAFVASLLLEGTAHYTAEEFAETAESYGISIQSSSGAIGMSMLAADLAKGLELLQEMVAHASFTPEAIEKIRAQMLAELQEFWDTPAQSIVQIVREEVYKAHPYSKNVLGTVKGVNAITHADILDYYKNYISPRGARIGIVGEIERYDIKKVFEHMLGSWQGPTVFELEYPPISQVQRHEVNKNMLRDQTVLCYGALSCRRLDDDHDKLLLFDQIFTGGFLGSMTSRLFNLREQSGLFYTIGGSLLSRSDEQKGLIIVKTIVSNDRRKEAEVAIEHVINTAADVVSDEEFQEAQQAVVNSLVDNFASNGQTASTLLFKDKFNLPADYYDTRAKQLTAITKGEMQNVAKRYLNTERFVLVRIGRI